MTAILQGDALTVLRERFADESVQCCVTSPPYWGLRDYHVLGQLGLEPTPEEYVTNLVDVFREVRRVLKPDGTLWLNLGDSYAGSGKGRNADGTRTDFSGLSGASGGCIDGVQPIYKNIAGLKPKDLVGIPWRVAFALQADGWYLRSDIIWHKPNSMPESVTDRPTKAHEYLFLLSKRERYYYDAEAIAEPMNFPERRYNPDTAQQKCSKVGTRLQGGLHDGRERYGNPDIGRNKRSVWTIATQPYLGAHFATFPEALVEPCILAGCPVGGLVLDPFAGSGTTIAVAQRLWRCGVGIELNADYVALAEARTAQQGFILEANDEPR